MKQVINTILEGPKEMGETHGRNRDTQDETKVGSHHSSIIHNSKYLNVLLEY